MQASTLFSVLRGSMVAATLAIATFSVPATAAMTSPNSPFGVPVAERAPVDAAPVYRGSVDREVRVDSATRWVNVVRIETIRFVFADSGKSFVWHFDTMGHPVFDLTQIAPAGVLGNQRVTVYVGRNPDEISG